MKLFEIVAHRGAHDEVPENTIQAFQQALEQGADAVELDVRLTADSVPVVYHYFYLNEITACSGPIFRYTLSQLQNVRFVDKGDRSSDFRIPTLCEVLETFSGKIGLEIEIKGPELESAEIIAKVLCKYRHLWETMEATSYEPMLLSEVGRHCSGLATDLLIPRSEGWMKPDVIAYLAIHRSRQAHARAVHLHPSQLSHEVVSDIRRSGIEVHAWDVNDTNALNTVLELNIPRIDTDRLQQMLDFRRCLGNPFQSRESDGAFVR
jgi:glycerophosphoryl diester phosphodiesterase